MNFGFVGSEPEWQQIKRHFDAQSAHRLVAVLIDATSPTGAPADPSVQSHAAVAAVRKFSDFEELLADPQIDALILGDSGSARAARLRRVAQHGRPCLCLPSAESNAILLHEVAMIAADNHTVLIPWLPGRLHPAWQELRAIHGHGAIETARNVFIERVGPLPNGRALAASSYAEAADLLAPFLGEITEVTATGDVAAGRLVVQHRTAQGPSGEIRLTAAASEYDRWQITVEWQGGESTAGWATGFDGPAILRLTGEAGEGELVRPEPRPGERILAEFARSLTAKSDWLDWSDAIRAAELADAAWLSLERRRSVDVFQEKRNELASFKGRMTSLGCGLIWFTLFMLILVAAGKGLEIPGADWLAAATILVWLVFLGLQALRWVFPSDENNCGMMPNHSHSQAGIHGDSSATQAKGH
jgi:predicted dehydrogenase